MSSKPERAYPTPYKKDVAFDQSSISLHPTPIPSFVSLICGENTYCSFSVVVKPIPFKGKVKSFRGYDPRCLKVWGHTVLTVHVCSVHIHTVCLEQSCREGEPLGAGAAWETLVTVRVLQLVQDAGRSSAIGSVWAWIKAGTETGNSDFCLCAAGPQRSWKVAFSRFLVSSFF